MRKTTEYFTQKLVLMHKAVIMDWIQKEFVESDKKSKPRKGKMYFQYKTREEIERKFRTGKVISGFMITGSKKICIAYRKKQRRGEMNVVGVRRVNPGHGHKVLGFAYVKCVLDDEKFVLQDVHIDDFMIHNNVNHYCLLLPFIDRGVFSSHFAVIFDDWDVGDLYFNKCLPMLCSLLFSHQVIKKNICAQNLGLNY